MSGSSLTMLSGVSWGNRSRLWRSMELRFTTRSQVGSFALVASLASGGFSSTGRSVCTGTVLPKDDSVDQLFRVSFRSIEIRQIPNCERVRTYCAPGVINLRFVHNYGFVTHTAPGWAPKPTAGLGPPPPAACTRPPRSLAAGTGPDPVAGRGPRGPRRLAAEQVGHLEG